MAEAISAGLSAEGVPSVLFNIAESDRNDVIAAGFGTYGWSGESLGIIEERLKSCGFAMPVPGVKAMG